MIDSADELPMSSTLNRSWPFFILFIFKELDHEQNLMNTWLNRSSRTEHGCGCNELIS